MRDRAIVLFATRWSLDSGQTGTTLHVLSDDVRRADAHGRPMAKLSGPVSLYGELGDLPGEYDLELSMMVRDGRGALACEHATYVGPPELGEATTTSSS